MTWLIGILLVSACGANDDLASPNADTSTSTGGQGIGGSTTGGTSTGGSIGQGGDTNAAGGAQAAGGSQAAGGPQNAGGTQAAGGSQDAGSTHDASGSDSAIVVGPDPKVLPCDGVSPSKGWEKITPPGGVPGDTQAIALDPFQVGTLYIQMHHGGNGAHSPTDGIYKSTDCGSTWKVVPGGKNARDNTPGEVNIHAGSIVSIIMDPVEPGVMYVASNYGPAGIFKSTNGGVDWDQTIPKELYPSLPANGWFNGLSVDPTDRKHLVGATHTGCSGAFAPNCLAETFDGAKTWRLISAPPTGNEQCGPYIHNSSTMLYASGQNGLYLTTNDGPANATPTWTKVGDGANGGDTGLFAYQASNGKFYLGTDYGITAGSSDFTSWKLDSAAPHQIVFIVGDGKNLFAASRGKSFYTAPEANPSTWTELPASGDAPGQAGRWLLYEKTHHILYSSAWAAGLYRLATQ
jgi:hypothetical protein